ncbi:MAG TPA: iron-containing alcohol dehydrogenase, partial [Candidatus Limnocylindria bacterium]|nr:iron-containing alcohol dehydrogenase [Candidatus Limnocylindria bacterium]
MSLTAFSFPTRTLFGVGALAELPAVLSRHGVHRPLIVTDGGLVKTAAFQLLANVLGAAEQGKSWFVYSGVHPNPVETDVKEAAAAYVANGCDGVVAIGGGSPLDAGKAARLLVKRPGFDLGKFYDEPDWSGLPPFVAIPTTAGTGSEVGRSSVITLDAT